MNLRLDSTPEGLCALLASVEPADDDSHLLWVDDTGGVHLARLPAGTQPADLFEFAIGVRFWIDPFDLGSGYAGAEAAADDLWTSALFDYLVELWHGGARGEQPLP